MVDLTPTSRLSLLSLTVFSYRPVVKSRVEAPTFPTTPSGASSVVRFEFYNRSENLPNRLPSVS